MERKRRRKDAPDIGENPFLVSFKNKVVVISKTTNLADLSQTSIEDNKLTEIIGDALNYKRNMVFEKDPMCMEYELHDGVDLYDIQMSLSLNAFRMYVWIKKWIKKNSTCVYIDKVAFMKRNGISSHTTYIAAKNDLILAGIITPSSSVYYGWYWVNPVFFFKGFRADVLKDYNDIGSVDLASLKAAREKKAEADKNKKDEKK